VIPEEEEVEEEAEVEEEEVNNHANISNNNGVYLIKFVVDRKLIHKWLLPFFYYFL
jgi:hypothetical protein